MDHATLKHSTSISRRPWWSTGLRGLFALLFGLAAIIWPGVTIVVLVTLFGAYALIDGIVALGVALHERHFLRRWWVLLFEGLVGIAFGAITLLWPAITALALLYLVAGWAIITGVFELIAAFSGQVSPAREWTLALAGVFSLLLGILLAAQPGMGLHVLAWFIGFYALFFGGLLIVCAFQHRSSAA